MVSVAWCSPPVAVDWTVRLTVRKTDVTHTGVDHLGPPGRRPVTLTVVVGAQERTALDHLAGDPELRLVGVEARLDVGTARVGRHAARFVRVVEG